MFGPVIAADPRRACILLVLLSGLVFAGCDRLKQEDCPPGMLFVPGGGFVSGAKGEEIGVYTDWPERWIWPRERKRRSTGAFCIEAKERIDPKTGKPTILVGWEQARNRCAQDRRRLCTEDEWTKACGGEEGWLFPYGDKQEPGRCNDDVYVGKHERTLPPGSKPRCKSPYGVLDMQGNVSEFVDQTWEEDRTYAVLRGGTMWTAIYGTGCMARHAHKIDGPTHWDDGFRCCWSPKRSTWLSGAP